MSTDRDSVKHALATMDFPASKEQLVSHVEHNSGDQTTIRAIRALPLADYENIGQVAGSVPLDKASEEGQSDSDKAQEQRHNQESGLAEHHTSTPTNPIVEERGDNRGS